MSIVAIKDFELEIQEFNTALNCSFMYAFSLCKLVFLYRYLKKVCDPLFLNLLGINLGSINIPILVSFIDKMNFYNGITFRTILILIQLYSGIFHTTFLTTRMMFIRTLVENWKVIAQNLLYFLFGGKNMS